MGAYSRHVARAGVPMPRSPVITPVDQKGVELADVPQIIEFEPAVQVAAGATGQVTWTVDVRDFHCTHIGFTSEGVGFPAVGQVFKIGITDVGASRTFQPHPWNVVSTLGTNPATSDHGPLELPVQWVFAAKTTVRIEFQNRGTLACTPNLVLIGYLGRIG